MSRVRLTKWVMGCLAWLLLYAGLYAYLKTEIPASALVAKDLIPFALGVPAVFLAAGLNRRNSYLHAMRELWQQLIPAVQGAIQYTHLTTPERAEFARTQERLSTAIDLVRGVFSNAGVQRNNVGLYPYENLKDIEKIVSWLGYGPNFRTTDADKARKCITRLWQEMHSSMLTEFDRDVPLKPVSKYHNDGKSVADLLFEGDLHDSDLSLGRRASQPRSGRCD